MATLNDFLRQWDSPEPFVEAHTSGSTGTPKLIRLLKSDMRVSARATNAFFGINSRSVLANPLSADYIAGKMMAVRAREAGCRLVELPVANEVRLTEPVDLLAVVPSQIPSLIADGTVRLARNILAGGAPLPAELAARLGDNAFVGYGMTETCSHVALRRVHDTEYTAMSTVRFETDGRGCLVILSDEFSWGRLVTNDMVRLIGPRKFEWLGRADNVINSGGLKIHPERLEAEIRSLVPDAPDFYIVGVPDVRWGSVAVIVAEGPLDLPAIKPRLCNPRTCPKEVIAVERLPRTSNGKLRRLPPSR